MTPNLNLATASIRTWNDDLGVPIITTVGKPRHGFGSNGSGTPTINELAPYGIFGHKPEYSQPEFIDRYMARLDAKQGVFLPKLAALAASNPDSRLVLLCWCAITDADHTSPDGFCHRRIAAYWFEQSLGLEVPELTLVVPKVKPTAVMGSDQIGLGF